MAEERRGRLGLKRGDLGRKWRDLRDEEDEADEEEGFWGRS